MTSKTIGLSATLVLLVVIAVAMVRAQVTRPGDTMVLWEYHTEIVRGPGPGTPEPRADPRRGSAPEAMLNSRGQDGWELVGVARREIRVDDGLQTETFYAFKRPTRSVSR
jgi:hypothetical protein